MKINLNETCGNSPKNTFVQDYTVMLLSLDYDYLANKSVENVKIMIPDRGLIEGKSNLFALEKWLPTDFEVLTIETAISHGKSGAAHCIMRNNNKDYMISVHYIFQNLKAQLIEEAVILIVEIK